MSTYTITDENLVQLDKCHVQILKKIGSIRLKGTDIWNCPLCGGSLHRKKRNGRYEFVCKRCKFKGNLVELCKQQKGFKPYPDDKSAYWDVAQELCVDNEIDVRKYVPSVSCDDDDYDISYEDNYDGDYVGPYNEHPAKETEYGGYRFRSKLEAKWAVFFDAVGIRWRYETQKYYCFCYDGDIQLDYGADFYLLDYDVYVEVKGTDDQLNMSNDPNDPNNPKKIPAVRIAHAIDYDATPMSRGLILLGELPYSKTLRSIDYFYGSLLFCARSVALGRFHISVSADGTKCIVDCDKSAILSSVDCVENCLPDGTTVNLKFHETYGNGSILDYGLRLARQARFDFMDSVEKMEQEGRDIVGGIQ